MLQMGATAVLALLALFAVASASEFNQQVRFVSLFSCWPLRGRIWTLHLISLSHYVLTCWLEIGNLRQLHQAAARPHEVQAAQSRGSL